MSLSSFLELFTLKLTLLRIGPKGGKSLQGDVQNYCFSLVLQQVLRFQEASTVLFSHQKPVFTQLYCCCGIGFIVSLLALLQAELFPHTSLFLNRSLHAAGECLTFWKHFHWFSLSLQQNTISLMVCKLACMFRHKSLHFLLLDTLQAHSFSFLFSLLHSLSCLGAFTRVLFPAFEYPLFLCTSRLSLNPQPVSGTLQSTQTIQFMILS